MSGYHGNHRHADLRACTLEASREFMRHRPRPSRPQHDAVRGVDSFDPVWLFDTRHPEVGWLKLAAWVDVVTETHITGVSAQKRGYTFTVGELSRWYDATKPSGGGFFRGRWAFLWEDPTAVERRRERPPRAPGGPLLRRPASVL